MVAEKKVRKSTRRKAGERRRMVMRQLFAWSMPWRARA
jgi:hypothetical protein